MTSIRVLLVEDEADIRTLLAELLCHDGYEVIEAGDGDQAVALINELDGFDLLLTDVQMPGPVVVSQFEISLLRPAHVSMFPAVTDGGPAVIALMPRQLIPTE